MKPGTALAVLLAIVAGVGGGILLERQVLSAQGAPPQQAGTGPRILYWWDPMIPDYKSDKPGKSPMGMDISPLIKSDPSMRDTAYWATFRHSGLYAVCLK
jgi:membrane fusion protein, copper/silver efflux system